MLATTGGLPPEDGRWALELKWDGVRAILRARPDGTLAVESRNGRDIAPSYPELQPLAAAVPADTTLDGEIVAFNERGQPDFGVLQHRMHVSRPTTALQAAVPAVLLVFDVITMADHDTTRLPYDERRGLLDGLALQGPSWQSPAAVDLPGAQLLAATKAQGLEGVMAKRRDSPYLPGIRSPHWVKVKNVRTQDVVIGGWEEGSGGRAGRLGALLVGVQTSEGLTYAGQVGTGFTDRALADLQARLAGLATDDCPLAGVPAVQARGAHWVRPELVGEVTLTAWTREDRLRHPSWKGLRADMDPAAVRRTEAVDSALQHLAGQPMSAEEAKAVEGAHAIGEIPLDRGPRGLQ